MTQQEAKECARRAWVASAVALKAPDETEDMAEATAEVRFHRWWRVHVRTLPGFRR